MQEKIKSIINKSISVKQSILSDSKLIESIEKSVALIVEAYKEDGKLLFCGNGGSAADAQHLAAEFSGRFYLDREPLYAEALHVNSSYLTAVANDYDYNEIYARMTKAMGRKGDVFIGLSTSGNSANVIRGVEEAKKAGMIVIGFTGESGGQMKELCDILINIPSTDTPRIQESHITVGHIICELVEAQIFQK
ncbi:MAG: phosphoheptose isomerase [Crocinitomix sp. MedPE-SWsnd]|jgi:D-sedoheptulose 7-phosphate isomerase|nr:MAG: phosphoheptose isomerase [Crocinitomix sp. MedPE-SWsnd]